ILSARLPRCSHSQRVARFIRDPRQSTSGNVLFAVSHKIARLALGQLRYAFIRRTGTKARREMGRQFIELYTFDTITHVFRREIVAPGYFAAAIAATVEPVPITRIL